VFTVDLSFQEYMVPVATVTLLIVLIFALQGLYAMQSRRRFLDETTRIFSGISMGVMIVIIYSFFRAALFQSRFIVLAAYLLALAFVTINRFLVRTVQRSALRRGYGTYRAVLAGNGRYGEELKSVIKRRPELGYRVVGELSVISWDALEELYRTKGIDEVIQTEPSLPDESNLVLLDFCDQYKIDYKYVPNLFETQVTNVRFRSIDVVPVVELLRTPLDGWGRIAKRGMDVLLSAVGIILLLPLWLIAAATIKLSSPGTVFYRQVRMGRNKQPFEIMKFRTMKKEYCTGERYGGAPAEEFENTLRQQTNERTGPLFKMRSDPRLTTIGPFLRKWRIDELPQLFNVLHGEMSLFGPRPHLPKEVERYTKHHRKLFTVKPGMSGMAQVQGSSGLPFEEEATLDIGYIENWSLRLDIVLLLKTLWILLTDKNAV